MKHSIPIRQENRTIVRIPLYHNSKRISYSEMKTRKKLEKQNGNLLKWVLRGFKRVGLPFTLLTIIVAYIAFKWVWGTVWAYPDLRTEIEGKYEESVLYKRCYEQQFKRLDEWKATTAEWCEEHYKQFRKEKGMEKAINFIANFEGFHPKAYFDYKQRSSGFGTKSYKWEVINLAIAKQRLADNVKARRDRTEGLNENQRVALTSFLYNAGNVSNILAYAKKGDTASVVYIMNATVYAGGKRAGGLVKRRSAEVLIFNKW